MDHPPRPEAYETWWLVAATTSVAMVILAVMTPHDLKMFGMKLASFFVGW
jgi:hypothetical protein